MDLGMDFCQGHAEFLLSCKAFIFIPISEVHMSKKQPEPMTLKKYTTYQFKVKNENKSSYGWLLKQSWKMVDAPFF